MDFFSVDYSQSPIPKWLRPILTPIIGLGLLIYIGVVKLWDRITGHQRPEQLSALEVKTLNDAKEKRGG